MKFLTNNEERQTGHSKVDPVFLNDLELIHVVGRQNVSKQNGPTLRHITITTLTSSGDIIPLQRSVLNEQQMVKRVKDRVITPPSLNQSFI